MPQHIGRSKAARRAVGAKHALTRWVWGGLGRAGLPFAARHDAQMQCELLKLLAGPLYALNGRRQVQLSHRARLLKLL